MMIISYQIYTNKVVTSTYYFFFDLLGTECNDPYHELIGPIHIISIEFTVVPKPQYILSELVVILL